MFAHTHALYLLQATEDGLWVGSSVTLSDLMDQLRSLGKTQPAYATSACTALLNQLKYFAGNQIRNTASVGGNIVTGSPISDTCPLYMACGATFVLQGQGMPQRKVLAEDFFLGYRLSDLPHLMYISPLPSQSVEAYRQILQNQSSAKSAIIRTLCAHVLLFSRQVPEGLHVLSVHIIL